MNKQFKSKPAGSYAWKKSRTSCRLSPSAGPHHLKKEREGVVSELPQQFGLDPGMDAPVAVLQRRVYLAGGQVELPAESDAHHVHVVSAVAKGAGQRDEH